jgi:hypothetical protein
MINQGEPSSRVHYRCVTSTAEFRVVTLGAETYVISCDLAGRERNDSDYGAISPDELVRPTRDAWTQVDWPYRPDFEEVLASATGRRIVWGAGALDFDPAAKDASCFPFLVDEVRVERYLGSPNCLLLLLCAGTRWIHARAGYVTADQAAARALAERLLGPLEWDFRRHDPVGWAEASLERDTAGQDAFERLLAGTVVSAYDSFPDEDDPLTVPEDVWHDFGRQDPAALREVAASGLTGAVETWLAPCGERGAWLWLERTSLPEQWALVRRPDDPAWLPALADGRSLLLLSDDRRRLIAARSAGPGRWRLWRTEAVRPMERLPRLGVEGLTFTKSFDAQGRLTGAEGSDTPGARLVDPERLGP